LGEFSPIGRLLCLGSFFVHKLLKYPKLEGYFFYGKNYAQNSTKNGLGYTLGDFVTNTPGHPAWIDVTVANFVHFPHILFC
jgi:hypothetical protein